MSGEAPFQILMVDDNPGDARLAREILTEANVPNRFHWVADGQAALAYLHQSASHHDPPLPDLILLDLNMPGLEGREILAEIKSDESLKRIPVIILTTSQAEDDVARAYQLRANCYIIKPVTLDEFIRVVESVRRFWFYAARLPTR